MFRAQSAHHQEVGVNCTHAASGIITLCKWLSFLSGCTRQSLAESDDISGWICTIYVIDLLMMGGLRSKHIEAF